MPFVRQPPNGRIVSLAFGGVQKEVVKGFHLSLETYVVIVSLSGLDWRFDLKPYFLRRVRWESTAALLKSWIPNPNESNLGRMKKSHGKAGIRFWSLALNGNPCKKSRAAPGIWVSQKVVPKMSQNCLLRVARSNPLRLVIALRRIFLAMVGGYKAEHAMAFSVPKIDITTFHQKSPFGLDMFTV